MSLPEMVTHSFIVRIWLEEIADEGGEAVWRGHITHAPSGKRHYIQSLDEVMDFIAAYLQSMGVQINHRRGVRKISMRLNEGGQAMPEIKWSANLEVVEGPKFTLAGMLPVHAYERIDLELRPNAPERTVEIEPDKNLCLLMIQRSKPDPKYGKPDPTKLTYKLAGMVKQPKEGEQGPHQENMQEMPQAGAPWRRRPATAEETGETEEIALEDIQLLLGSDIHKLLKFSPTRISFQNRQDQVVTVSVLLGRRIDDQNGTTVP